MARYGCKTVTREISFATENLKKLSGEYNPDVVCSVKSTTLLFHILMEIYFMFKSDNYHGVKEK